MPCLKIMTNQEISGPNEFMAKASERVCAVLGKPEEVMMVTLEDECRMFFAGSRQPAVYMELKGIGLDESFSEKLSAELCLLVSQALDVAQDRVYIVFEGVERKMWGVNGTTF